MATRNLIASTTVGAGGAASIVFGSGDTIPQTYTDLLLYASLKVDATTGGWGINRVKLKINAISSGYSNRLLYAGGGTSPGSDVGTDEITFHYANAPGSTANTFSVTSIYIPAYTGNTYKSFSVESVADSNSTSLGIMALNAGLLSNTAPITSLTLASSDSGVVFLENSTAYLYGILNK